MPVSLQNYKIMLFSHLIGLMFSIVFRNVFIVYFELQDNLLKFCAVPFYVQKYMRVCVCVCVRACARAHVHVHVCERF
jgi:predicted membrane channel-forming protein YqfA (hemolysin III family)